METRTRHVKSEYETLRGAYRAAAGRHVLVIEADMPPAMKYRVASLSNQLRICGNELAGRLSKRLEQLRRTKKYRSLQKAYGKLSDRLKTRPDDRKADGERKAVAREMSDMQKEYRVTWDDARKYMDYLKENACLGSIFALSRAEDVWCGIEKVLYGDGGRVHFRKRGDLPELRAKQANRGIVIGVEDGQLCFTCAGIAAVPKPLPGGKKKKRADYTPEEKGKFTHVKPDRFQADELAAVIKYLESPEAHDLAAAETYARTGIAASTYRPCYASLVCKEIRGKLRVFIHLTIEGRPLPKYKPDGTTPRHTFGKGRVGGDIGTQTVAYTSKNAVGLKNLAERGMTISHAERTERRLLRAIDRSRRAMNPGNYNPDGTIRKGKKTWVKSNRGRALERRHRELCRKNAESRHYAINEDANMLRTLGDVFITEPPNFKALQKRAKDKPDGQAAERPRADTAAGQKKKNQRKKRFGKSLKNRCPGTFQAAVRRKFESTGGEYHEVDKMFRASQYDHTADDYIKKKLSDRMFRLADGTEVQRDWYSSFLLYCSDTGYLQPDRGMCIGEFGKLYGLQEKMIEAIREAGIHVMNSGIR